MKSLQSEPSLIDYAKGLLHRGMICVPVCERGKQISFRSMDLPPYHEASGKKHLKDLAFSSIAFHLALKPPTEGEVADWFSGHTGNVGIVSGFNQLIVLDFDRMNVFRNWEKQYSDIARSTPVATSPRGIHLFLACQTLYESSSLYFGGRKAGHLKALGGYVVSSPSVVKEGEYQWIPGQSAFELSPYLIENLKAISMFQSGRMKRLHDRLLKRGSFIPDEKLYPKETQKN